MHLSPALLRLCLGNLTSTELPAIIELGDLMHELDNLWKRSIRNISRGTVVECGGVLALGKKGDLALVNVTIGEAGWLQLNLEVGSDWLFVGSFHTHPHVSGVRGAAFGARDFAFAINSGSMLTLVHSGRYLYALVRTELTPATVNADSLHETFNKTLAHVRTQGYTTLETLLETNLQLCERYGLAFYYAKVPDPLQEVYRP
jgi:hypothetical protein